MSVALPRVGDLVPRTSPAVAPGAATATGPTPARRPRRTGSSLGSGFRVLGVAIRREPWVFTLSTLGSVLFGALTVADAWVLGWATDEVVLPAFDTGTTTTKGLVAIVALFL